MQGLLKRLTEVTERLECDAAGVYNQNRHMAIVAVRGLSSATIDIKIMSLNIVFEY